MKPLNLIGLFLGAPESKVWHKANVHNLEKQSIATLSTSLMEDWSAMRATGTGTDLRGCSRSQ